MTEKPVFDTTENGDTKSVWLCKGRWQLSMQIGTDGDHAYFGIEDLKTESGGHEVALGVEKDGRPFLQVCSGKEYERVDLVSFIKAVKKLLPEE